MAKHFHYFCGVHPCSLVRDGPVGEDGFPITVDWFVGASYLQRPKNVALMREGLRLAGLSAETNSLTRSMTK